MTETAARTAWYAYAVVGPVDDALRAALGDGLELVGGDDAAVVVGEVPLLEFAEDALTENLNDRAWLDEHARAHDGLLRRLLPLTTVVPLRFGSIQRDLAGVEEFLEERRAPFGEALRRLRGRVELGVKVWVDPARRAADDAPAPATGREYLQRQREARERASTARADLDAALRHVHERLLAVADAGILNRPQPRELTGSERAMALNAAYLVRVGDDALLDEVERLRAELPELDLEVTGPWAPYNFVEADAS